MVIVVTGVVGIDKKQYLAQVQQIAQSYGTPLQIFHVGQMMYAEAPDVPAGRILDISLQRLHSIRRSVFKDIIAQARQFPNVIVNTHATFRWRHGLFPAFDFYQVRQLKPDLFICLIDGVEPLHMRLTEEHPIRHTLKDLIVWREEETLATQLMQQGSNESARFYILARGGAETTARTFYQLAFEPQRKKAYLSFPMTHVVGMPDILAQIEQFRGAIKQRLICFDPADLEEAYLPVYAKQAKAQGKTHIELTVLGRTARFSTDQIEQITQDVQSQIYARDFALIEQADMIISFIPHQPNGQPILSSGVERELQHAHESAKRVYVIWTSPRPPSVFISQTAHQVFASIPQALEYLSAQYPYTPTRLFD